MVSKLCHLETHDRYRKPLGVAGATMSNQLPLDAVLLGYEQEDGEVGQSENGVGRLRGVVGLLSNEELEVLETEGVLGGIGTALAVFA